MDSRPIIGITMGDPFSIGPEITLRTLADPEIYRRCRPVIIGDLPPLRQAAQILRAVSDFQVNLHPISDLQDAVFTPGTVDVLDLGLITPEQVPNNLTARGPTPFGIGPTPFGGEAAFRYVEKVIALAMDGKVDATVTNAISKEAINLAGHHFAGHTEIYAHFTNTKKYTMMLAHENLRVVHVSTHVSLREACDRVKKGRVLECIQLADACCKALGIAQPKIGVCGLNPHSGENGMFGREEIEEIQPAIDEALKLGFYLPDPKPLPPDSAFSKALGGWYDILVVMYHDQGHIPLKVKGFVYDQDKQRWNAVSGINVTLGLPIIRVSVDHGTGFDQAGCGQASPVSLNNALDYAIQMAVNKGH